MLLFISFFVAILPHGCNKERFFLLKCPFNNATRPPATHGNDDYS